MRKLFIYILLSGACLMLSCSSPQKKLEGKWVVSSIVPVATPLAPADLESLNGVVRGLEYTFRNDSTFINDSLVGTYVADTASITLHKTDENVELYGYTVSDDSLSIVNEMFILNMSRKAK